ncbi:hypothetical protein GCM10020000_59760 [Streptomyces olivoverticillatus]
MPAVRKSTSRPEVVGEWLVITLVTAYAISVARMKAMPPMVGVPFFPAWPRGPSSRMNWP